MGFSHEPVADHPDPQSFGHIKVGVELDAAAFIVTAHEQVNG